MSRSVSVCPCMRVEIDGKNDYLTKSGYPNRQDDRFRGKNMLIGADISLGGPCAFGREGG